MAKMQLPKSLTRVTGFSKALAVLIIFIFMMFAFYLGIQYQKKAASLGVDVSPTPTVAPVQDNQATCETDTDCVLAFTNTDETSAFCCPNTRCLDVSKTDVKAVNSNWLGAEKNSVCVNHRMCPMIATICTKQIQESNSHYSAKCIHNTCQKVYR